MYLIPLKEQKENYKGLFKDTNNRHRIKGFPEKQIKIGGFSVVLFTATQRVTFIKR